MSKLSSTLLILLSILIIACSDASVKDNNFATNDPIDKILIASSNGDHVVLTKTQEQWRVNDKHLVRMEMMDVLLQTIKRVKVNYPVSQKEQEGIIRNIAAEHVKVELYNGQNLVKSYFVGDHTQDQLGTYFFMENGKRPYVCHIPGFDGYLTPRFFTNEEEWRTRVVFHEDIQNIQSIKVAYGSYLPNAESFEITQEGNNIQLTNLANGQTQDLSGSELGKQYLTFYEHLELEGFENEWMKKDSIIKTEPFCELILTLKDGTIKTADMYLMDLTQRSKTQFDRKGNKLKHDLDRLYISFNDGKDFGIIQMFVFGKLFQDFSSFDV